LAKHIASWSKDTTQVGSVIINPVTNHVVSLGYNGFPRGVDDTSERYSDRDTKLKLVCHAELNAILNSNTPVRGCDIYVYPTMMNPASCPDCSKAIVQSGIRRLYYYSNKNTNPKWEELESFSKIILNEGGIQCIEVNPNE
jgi:dCMP deaminase